MQEYLCFKKPVYPQSYFSTSLLCTAFSAQRAQICQACGHKYSRLDRYIIILSVAYS